MTVHSPSPFDRLAASGLRSSTHEAWLLFEEAKDALLRALGAVLRSLGVDARHRADVGQRVLVRMWDRRRQYRGTSTVQLVAWMRSIARSEFARQLDEERRAPRAVEDVGALEPRSRPVDAVAFEVERSDAIAALGGCIACALTPKERAVVELLYSELGWNERQVGEVLGYKKAYVNEVHARALGKLVRCLRRKGIEAPFGGRDHAFAR